MKASIFLFSANQWEKHASNQIEDDHQAQLLLCFGAKAKLQGGHVFDTLKQKFPSAEIVLCSTAGEIYQDNIYDDAVVAVALSFSKTPIQTASVNIGDFSSSYHAAIKLISKLPKDDLSYLMVFSDGGLVNGTKLVDGLNTAAGKGILVTGGLAGDGTQFRSTLVGVNEIPSEGKIVAIGFYGNNIRVTHGSEGGGDTFGLEKLITKSTGNVLFEMEDQNALELYKKYLGDEAANLPASALLYPLSVILPGAVKPVVRTILSIDEERQCMTFSGDVPKGSKVRFMKATMDKLIESASTAAQQTLINENKKPKFSLLISCVGRKLILGSRTVDEIRTISKSFGNETLLAGFYSYGEISPASGETECKLHNQTMTITSFYES